MPAARNSAGSTFNVAPRFLHPLEQIRRLGPARAAVGVTTGVVLDRPPGHLGIESRDEYWPDSRST